MKWEIIYHSEVVSDLESIGPSNARRIMKAIDFKLTKNPIDFGQPLSGNLANFRKLRVGDFRIVYQIQRTKITVYVLAVGPRRDKEIYKAALKRI
jgi:mRNA interferase RelE/StbE